MSVCHSRVSVAEPNMVRCPCPQRTLRPTNLPSDLLLPPQPTRRRHLMTIHTSPSATPQPPQRTARTSRPSQPTISPFRTFDRDSPISAPGTPIKTKKRKKAAMVRLHRIGPIAQTPKISTPASSLVRRKRLHSRHLFPFHPHLHRTFLPLMSPRPTRIRHRRHAPISASNIGPPPSTRLAASPITTSSRRGARTPIMVKCSGATSDRTGI